MIRRSAHESACIVGWHGSLVRNGAHIGMISLAPVPAMPGWPGWDQVVLPPVMPCAH
jgi:hypothetical protein